MHQRRLPDSRDSPRRRVTKETVTMTDSVSPEVKDTIRAFVAAQRKKYGEDWKSKLAAEMAAKTAPVVERLLTLRDAVSERKQ